MTTRLTNMPRMMRRDKGERTSWVVDWRGRVRVFMVGTAMRAGEIGAMEVKGF
jgi:hypothetical protein